MAGEEPQMKKRKSDVPFDERNKFLQFHGNKVHELKSALSFVQDPLSGYGVAVSKIEFCDAKINKTFSKATCTCKELCDLNLNVYTAEPSGSTEEALSHLPYDASPAEWTVMVAHHLLSKLTVSSTYLLDSESTEEPWKKDRTCPCGCNENIDGAFGDTSLGVPSHWHGRVDILTDVAVKIIVPEEPESDDAGNRSTKIKMAAYRDEIRAGAIVYSFLMRKKHPELDNFLIPTVVMSKTHIAVVFYDCENDILLETPLPSLFQQGNDVILSKSTILILWLALNFKYCCSGVPDEIIDTGYKANFFRHTGSVLESYRRDVNAPCDYVATFDWFVLPVFETLPLKK